MHRDKTHHILIEEVNDHVGQSTVAPVSVNQEEFFQVFEARYSEVTCHDRLWVTNRKESYVLDSERRGRKHIIFKASDLHALLTRYPNADISCLDHVDVICTIT